MSNSGLKALLLQLQDIIAYSKPSKETFWFWVAAAAIFGGLSYWADSTGTFTIPALVSSAIVAGLHYGVSKARHEDAKAIQAEADQRIADVLTPPVGSDDF